MKHPALESISLELCGIKHLYRMFYDLLNHIARFFFFLSQNRILWIDEKNLTAHVEAGIVGQDLERLVSTPHPSIFIH